MGKHKTQRTDQLRQAAKRYVIAEEACNRIEQHNFDRMVKAGVIVRVRYIQQTEWWQKTRKAVAKAFSRERQQFMDDVIIKAFTDKKETPFLDEGRGQGRQASAVL